MDNQIVFELLTHTIQASKALKQDQMFADTLDNIRKQIPPMQIGQFGQLQEWIKDWDRPDDKHRHISHLYGLYPANQISPYRNPELFSHKSDPYFSWRYFNRLEYGLESKFLGKNERWKSCLYFD
jgi:alpha-L-fucosidase 2